MWEKGDVWTNDLNGSVSSISFSPTDNFLAVGYTDSTAQLFDIMTGEFLQGELKSDRDHWIDKLAFSPDAKTLAISSDEEITFRDTRTFGQIGQPIMLPDRQYVTEMAFSPSGQLFTSVSRSNASHEDQYLNVWMVNPSESELLFSVIQPANGLQFMPDGKRLITFSQDKLLLWNLETRVQVDMTPAGFDDEQGMYSYRVIEVGVTSSGKILIVMASAEKVYLWDAAKRKIVLGPITTTGESVIDAVLSLDGKLLATLHERILPGEFQIQYYLWDVSTGQSLGGGFPISPSFNSNFQFSFDNRIFVYEDQGKVVFLDLDPQALIEKACLRAGRNLTQAEWQQYFSGEEYRLTCPQWPAEE